MLGGVDNEYRSMQAFNWPADGEIGMKAEFPEKAQFLFEPYTFKGMEGGRGSAKSQSAAKALLVIGEQVPIRVLCGRETMKSLTDSVQALLEDQVNTLGYGHYYECQTATILGKPFKKDYAEGRFEGMRTEFIFAGLKQNINSIKSYEKCDIAWIEEAANVSEVSWQKLIPTIRTPSQALSWFYYMRGLRPKPKLDIPDDWNDPEIWITWNEELEEDATHKRFKVNPPKNSKIVTMNWRDNPWFPRKLQNDMEEDREKLSEDTFNHIWEGKCRSSVEGAIYGLEMKRATEENRICQVSYDRTKPVDTAWDIGFGDSTAIWFVQAWGGQYHFIDYIEDNGKTVHDYLIMLQNKGYRYGTHYLPHDALDTIIHGKLAAEKDRSIYGIITEQGYKVKLVDKTYKFQQIDTARTIFPLCRFDAERCSDGIRALRSYQWGPPSASGAVKRDPLHDWASHASSAFQYACWAVKQQPNKLPSKPSGKPRLAPASAWS